MGREFLGINIAMVRIMATCRALACARHITSPFYIQRRCSEGRERVFPRDAQVESCNLTSVVIVSGAENHVSKMIPTLHTEAETWTLSIGCVTVNESFIILLAFNLVFQK